jgi:hypothetical protein
LTVVENALASQIGFDYVPAVNSDILRRSQDAKQMGSRFFWWRV